MSYRTVQWLAVVAATPFGFAFLLAPELVASWYGIGNWNGGTLVVARLYGAVLLMLAGACYSCISIEDLGQQRRVALLSAIPSALAALVSVQSVVAGSTNSLMWTTVVLFGFFTAAWLAFWVSAGHGRAAHA